MLITVKGEKYLHTGVNKNTEYYSEVASKLYSINPELIESITHFTGYHGVLAGNPTEEQVTEFRNYKRCHVVMRSGDKFFLETDCLYSWLQVTKNVNGVKLAG